MIIFINWHDYFVYDITSPSYLRWNVERPCGGGKGKTKIGDMAGSLNRDGYYRVGLKGKRYKVHRVIYEMFKGKIPDGETIDHYNRIKTHNDINNLRLGNDTNDFNQSKRSHNKSGITGISLIDPDIVFRARWVAQWVDFLTGKNKSRTFGVNKFGYEQAFRLALDCRKKMIEEQNLLGANYTPTHGA